MSGNFDWGGWGNVPDDGDVRPFSRINPEHSTDQIKKKHQFISVTYMNGFTGSDGRLWRYLADKPADPQRVAPRSFGYEKFYYSQKMPDGTQENHKFENLWSAIETVWAATMRAVADHRMSPAISLNLLGMATIMKTRVPAARERNERLIAAGLRAKVQAEHEIGILPPEYQCYADELDTVPVGVNPQQTLLAMNREFKEFGDLCFRLGFEVLHNKTGIPFISSDNPVCIYDPSKPIQVRRPYDFKDEIELIFPIDAWTLLRGSNKLRPVNRVVRDGGMSSSSAVRRINRTIAQFSYRFVIALDRSSDDLALQYSPLVPTIEFDVRRAPKEVQIVWNHVFGSPPQLSQFIDTPEKAARLEARMAAARSEGGESTVSLKAADRT
jgi:hypothetical protein